MQIARLEGFTFPVPFKIVFKHASASRRMAENFVVCVTSKSGVNGFGEGCPRSYVTGEDTASCNRFLLRHRNSLVNAIEDVESLRDWTQNHRLDIDTNPSAFCAIEMAVLDVLGKERSLSIESLLGIPRYCGVVRFTAVLGDAPFAAYWWLSRRYIQRRFIDIKIKLSGSMRRDQRKLKLWAGRSRRGWRIRLDANNLWSDSVEAANYLSALPDIFWAIEEPLQPRDFAGMQSIGMLLGCRLVLDESCTNDQDLEGVSGEHWVVNLRVSKVGGVLRALELAHKAQERKIGIILGAHVGETSLLTRGTLAVVQSLRNRQIACEGAFGRNLLTSDLSNESIEFDENARIDLGTLQLLQDPGTGLSVDPKKLQVL